MILRKCNFELEQYSERDHPKGVTTEIINKPLNYEFRGFLHLNHNEARAIMHHLKKPALHRVMIKVASFR